MATMTQPNLRIKNPSVTLYAFQLRSEMTNAVVADAHHLWEKLTQLGELFAMPALQHFTDQLICYQNGQYYSDGERGHPSHFLELIQPERELSFSSVLRDNLTLGASIYPLRVHDTYAVDFTLNYQNQTVDVNQLCRFNPQACLMPSHIQASLGQTLLLYAEPIGEEMVLSDLATECVNALLQDTQQTCPALVHQGQLFGSPIFAFETITPDNAPHPNKLFHILVWLGKHEQTLSLVEQANRDLIHLLRYRQKILFSYHQAQQSNHLARRLYNELETKMQQLHQLPTEQEKWLDALERLLTETSLDTIEYARYLRNLADHYTTLKTNAMNYAKWLGHIREFSLKTDNLAWLEDFHAKTCTHHQQQLEIYLDYLKPGHHLFEQMTRTLVGLVQIGEQKQQMIREHKFEYLITFIGAAVGTGAISATVMPEPPHLIHLLSHWFALVQLPILEMPSWFTHFSSPPLEILHVMFHLLVGGVTALVFTPVISVMARWFTRK